MKKYVCPTCGREFEEESCIRKHFLKCWKEQNPHYKSKAAPHGEDITTIEMNAEMADFWKGLLWKK